LLRFASSPLSPSSDEVLAPTLSRKTESKQVLTLEARKGVGFDLSNVTIVEFNNKRGSRGGGVRFGVKTRECHWMRGGESQKCGEIQDRSVCQPEVLCIPLFSRCGRSSFFGHICAGVLRRVVYSLFSQGRYLKSSS